jgi:hypothetical protein
MNAMKRDCKSPGAVIERGTVLSETDGMYTVASVTRPGVETLPLEALPGASFAAGDSVYFFAFPDGRGVILKKLEGA